MDADMIKVALAAVAGIIGWIIKIEINRSHSNTKIEEHAEKLIKHSKRFDDIYPRIQKMEIQVDNKIDKNDLYEKFDEFKKDIENKFDKLIEKIDKKFESIN